MWDGIEPPHMFCAAQSSGTVTVFGEQQAHGRYGMTFVKRRYHAHDGCAGIVVRGHSGIPSHSRRVPVRLHL